jgi:hypothetical protein
MFEAFMRALVVIVLTDIDDTQRIPVSLPISVTDIEINIPQDGSQNGRRANVLALRVAVPEDPVAYLLKARIVEVEK